MCLVYGGRKRHLTGWHSVAARAAHDHIKKPRSRARSGQLQCRVGRVLGAYRFPMGKATGSLAHNHVRFWSRSEAGHKAGERVSGVCARVAAPSGRRRRWSPAPSERSARRTACDFSLCSHPLARRAVRDHPVEIHSNRFPIAAASACAYHLAPNRTSVGVRLATGLHAAR